jgi:hypothetical protein
MLPADQGSQFCSAVGRQQRANNAAAQHRYAEACDFARRDRASQGVQAPGLFMMETL